MIWFFLSLFSALSTTKAFSFLSSATSSEEPDTDVVLTADDNLAADGDQSQPVVADGPNPDLTGAPADNTPHMPDMDHKMPEKGDDPHDHGHNHDHDHDAGMGHDDKNDGMNVGGGHAGDHGNHGGHGDHGGHEMPEMIEPPKSAAEISAFVKKVINAPEMHVHDHGSSLLGEHMAILDLVGREEATHIAIGNGDWFDPKNWHNGEVPGDNAKVLIPESITLSYGDESDARLFTVRVDGKLDFATDQDSKMVVDTFVVSPSGHMTAGTEDAPVEAGTMVDIVIANNGAIDVDWDPTLLSRGLISHGEVQIHGLEKDAHEKVLTDPMAGDRSIKFDDLPEGWSVGDKIVVAGTHYDGHHTNSQTRVREYHGTEDEVRYISKIDGNTIYFDEPLEFDHDTPRADLKTSVANYSRNVKIGSEDGADSEVFERGHVMFMHSDNVDVRYAEFDELGRTDKSERAHDVGELESVLHDSNVKGRYSLHLHRLGTHDIDDPAIVIGNSVNGSPGWGFVHHDSNALLQNNASFDTFGAGYVAESGNETGIWNDNIAIKAEGVHRWGIKNFEDQDAFDLARTGNGFFFQGRLVESSDNIAASVNNGFVYHHRGPTADDAKLPFAADDFMFPELFAYLDEVPINKVPILTFKDNEAFASREGLHVVKSSAAQGHDVYTVLEGLTAWEVSRGAEISYTSNYILKDFDIIGDDGSGLVDADTGIELGKNAYNIVITDAKVDGFETGIELHKGSTQIENFEGKLFTETDLHDYVIIDPKLTNNENSFQNFDPKLDTILSSKDLSKAPVSLDIDGELYYTNYGEDKNVVQINGVKTDSLGTRDFPSGVDNYDLKMDQVISLLEHNGYYTADDGHNYMVVNLYFSDSASGDVYKQAELLEFDDRVPLGNPEKAYAGAKFNGQIKLSKLKDMTDNGPELVASQEDLVREEMHDPDYFDDDMVKTIQHHSHHKVEDESFLDKLAKYDDPDMDHMPHGIDAGMEEDHMVPEWV